MDILHAFLKSPKTIGAISSSSRYLADEICIRSGVGKASRILELGPGTGIFTSRILNLKKSEATFSVIEREDRFVEKLKSKFEDLEIHHGDALDLLEQFEDGCLDCVVSGLPWAAFDRDFQEDLLQTLLQKMASRARFSTFVYVQSPYLSSGKSFSRLIHEKFDKVEISPLISRNFPPANVFTMQR